MYTLHLVSLPCYFARYSHITLQNVFTQKIHQKERNISEPNRPLFTFSNAMIFIT